VEHGEGCPVRGGAAARPASSAFDLLREQISLDLHAGIDALADVEPPSDAEARASLEAEVARLADHIEKIGPVNVLAIEEHQELEQRESFLRTQRDDLVQAIESLRGTIRKINLTSRELFRDAFNAVNIYFGELFTSLFGAARPRCSCSTRKTCWRAASSWRPNRPEEEPVDRAPLRRRAGPHRAGAALCHLPLQAVAVLHPRRSRRAAGRDQQRALRPPGPRHVARHAVHRHHPLPPHHGSGGHLYGVTMEEAGCSRLVSVNFAEMEG